MRFADAGSSITPVRVAATGAVVVSATGAATGAVVVAATGATTGAATVAAAGTVAAPPPSLSARKPIFVWIADKSSSCSGCKLTVVRWWGGGAVVVVDTGGGIGGHWPGAVGRGGAAQPIYVT